MAQLDENDTPTESADMRPFQKGLATTPMSADKLVARESAKFAVTTLAQEIAASPSPQCAPESETALYQAPSLASNCSNSAEYLNPCKTALGSGMVHGFFWLQLFNITYLTIACLVIVPFIANAEIPYFGTEFILGCLLVFSIGIGLLIGQLTKKGREQFVVTNATEFPAPVRKSLRTAALVIPMIVMVAAGIDGYALKSTEHASNLPIYQGGIRTPVKDAERYGQALEQAASLAFYNAGTLHILSSRARHAGLPNAAIRYADQARALFPQSETAKMEKGLALISSPALKDEARSWIDKELQLTPKDGNLWGLKTRLELQSGRYQDAVAASNVHLQFHAQEPLAYQLRATAYECLNNSEAARADLATATELEKSAN